MSRKNGDRARFDLQRKAKIHNRSRIRELRKAIRAQEPNKKGAIESSDGGA